jgi:hypothetical protein
MSAGTRLGGLEANWLRSTRRSATCCRPITQAPDIPHSLEGERKEHESAEIRQLPGHKSRKYLLEHMVVEDQQHNCSQRDDVEQPIAGYRLAGWVGGRHTSERWTF